MPEPVRRQSSTFPWELEPGLSGLNQQPQGHLVALTSLATYNHRHHEQLVTPGSQEGAAYPNVPKTWDLATLTPFVARKYSKLSEWEGKNNWSKKQKLCNLNLKGEVPPQRAPEWRFENRRSLFLNVCTSVQMQSTCWRSKYKNFGLKATHHKFQNPYKFTVSIHRGGRVDNGRGFPHNITSEIVKLHTRTHQP